MRFRINIVFIALLILGCKQENVEDIQLLNGYWEIEKVVFENGESKDYPINETIDQFIINDSLSGSRVKVRALLDGSFITVTEGEKINVKNENNHWVIYYKTDFFTWKETIKKLDNDYLEVLNEENKTYVYKRFSLENRP